MGAACARRSPAPATPLLEKYPGYQVPKDRSAANPLPSKAPIYEAAAFKVGDIVEAHSLSSAAHFNGLRGKIKIFQDERIGVDFGPPHGEKALKSANLRAASQASISGEPLASAPASALSSQQRRPGSAQALPPSFARCGQISRAESASGSYLPEGLVYANPDFGELCLEAHDLEKRRWANREAAAAITRRALGTEVILSKLLTVNGRVVVVLDRLIPTDLLEHFYGCLQGDSFRRTEFARPDTREFKHSITEYNPESLRRTRLHALITQAVESLFPQPAAAPLQVYRIYTNALLFGDVAFVHRDSCDHNHATVLLYPNLDWASELGGETLFYDEDGEIAGAIEPRPGRVVIFHGSIMHKGSPPGRLVFGSRYTTAFKLAPSEPEDIASEQAEE